MLQKASELIVVNGIKTGTFIDVLSGIGGVPRGVITEIWGDASVGKSTLCLQMIASAQKDSLRCLLVDVEYSVAPLYAEKLGVNLKKLNVLREKTAEDILVAMEESVKSGKYDLIVLDSVGALTPREELEKGPEGRVMGAQARLIARFCRSIIPLLFEKQVALVLTNHSFVDIMSSFLKVSGGKKLEYAKSFSVRLKVDSTKVVKVAGEKAGKVIVGVVAKNKVAPTEGREESSVFIFNKGFSAEADLLQQALDKGIVVKNGRLLFFGETKLGFENAARELIQNDITLQESLKTACGTA